MSTSSSPSPSSFTIPAMTAILISATAIKILVIIMVNIYFEKQNGNLCRLHSINHYYGEQKLTIKDFYKLSN